MKRPLAYLLLTRLKNQFLALIRSPGKLIYVLFLIAMLVLVIMTGGQQPDDLQNRRETGELFAGLFALFLIMFVLLAKRGFDTGASLFNLADVNLVFTAPFRSQAVLVFGLIQQMGTSLLLGLFLVFQYSWLRQLYGIAPGTLLLILLGYALTVFLGQLTAMLLYSIISSNEKWTSLLKVIFYGIIGLYAGWAAVRLLTAGDGLPEAIQILGQHRLTQLFPVAGWVSALIAGAVTAAPALVLKGSLLCTTYLALLVALLLVSRTDFYEDVLQTSETNFSTLTAQKEGRIMEAAPRRVRLGKVGLGRGEGAAAFYYKHKIENRRSRVLIVNLQSLVFIIIVLVMAFFMQGIGIIGIFAFSTYIQLFSTSLGRLNKELTRPYIYLIPAPSVHKLLQSVRERVPAAISEALLLFIPLALMLKLDLPDILGCIIARFTFTFLFTAGNILVERVFGAMTSKTLVFMFYFAALLLMALPGILLASLLAALGLQLVSATLTSLLAVSLANTLVALLVFYLCRNMLQYAELNNR